MLPMPSTVTMWHRCAEKRGMRQACKMKAKPLVAVPFETVAGAIGVTLGSEGWEASGETDVDSGVADATRFSVVARHHNGTGSASSLTAAVLCSFQIDALTTKKFEQRHFWVHAVGSALKLEAFRVDIENKRIVKLAVLIV